MIRKRRPTFSIPIDSRLLCSVTRMSITTIFGAVSDCFIPHCLIITVLVGIYASGEPRPGGGGLGDTP